MSLLMELFFRTEAKSVMGQSQPKFDVRVVSALHPIATKSQTSRHFGFGH